MSAHEEADLCREAAIRLLALRLSLGYETAASFARAIGYSPGKYRRYERRMSMQAGPVVRLAEAIGRVQHVSLDWLISGDPARQPPSISGSKVVSFTRRRAMN